MTGFNKKTYDTRPLDAILVPVIPILATVRYIASSVRPGAKYYS